MITIVFINQALLETVTYDPSFTIVIFDNDLDQLSIFASTKHSLP
jgi:hypothetical protein